MWICPRCGWRNYNQQTPQQKTFSGKFSKYGWPTSTQPIPRGIPKRFKIRSIPDGEISILDNSYHRYPDANTAEAEGDGTYDVINTYY